MLGASGLLAAFSGQSRYRRLSEESEEKVFRSYLDFLRKDSHVSLQVFRETIGWTIIVPRSVTIAKASSLRGDESIIAEFVVSKELLLATFYVVTSPP